MPFSPIEFLDVGSVFLTTHNHTKLVEDNVFFLTIRATNTFNRFFKATVRHQVRMIGEVTFPLKH